MRKIKFRGLSIETKEWVYGYLIKNKRGTFILDYSKGEGRVINKVYDKSVGQFVDFCIGEKEVYEGDVLKLNGGADDFYAEVGFAHGCFTAVFFDGNKTELKHYLGVNFVTTEIIGNTYQNPESLKS